MLLTDYAPNYGPEIWSLKYRIRQQNLGNDYWNSTILRPAYNQLYPPEKGQPRTFVEVRYPEGSAEPTLAARLTANDPDLERIRNSSQESTKALGLVSDGNSTKAALVTDRGLPPLGAVPIVAGAQARMTLAVIDAERGIPMGASARKRRLPPPTTKSVDPESAVAAQSARALAVGSANDQDL